MCIFQKLGEIFFTAQKMFSIKDFFSKCEQIRIFLRIWSHLLKKSLMKKFIFCAVIDKLFLDSEAVALRRPAEKAILKKFLFVFYAVSQNPSGL